MKNIVFDIGNVLVDYRLKEFLAAKGFDGLMIKRIIKASIMSPYWEAFERSELTEDEALEAFASLDPEIKDEIKLAYSEIHGMLTLREGSVEFIKALKDKGYKTYYLSNYSSKAYRECADSIVFMEYMEGGVLSFEARMTKPDPEMYKFFLNKFNLDPHDCIFVDDTEENVIIAKELGFEGIVYKSYEETVEELAKLGVAF